MRTLRRVPFRVVVPIVLMAVLAVLAALQYRWLGQVSLAERQRMHETMTARARALAIDIDREISRLYVTFQLASRDAVRFDAAVAERHKLWRETTRHPDLIAGLYAVSAEGGLQEFEPATGTLRAIEWPDSLKAIRERTRASRVLSQSNGRDTFSFRLPPMINTDPLAVSVIVPFMTHHTREGAHEVRLVPSPGSLLIVINEQKFLGEIVPQLVTQHLGDSLDEYRLSIVRTRAPGEAVYGTARDAVVKLEEADVRVDALGMRPAINERLLATELRVVAAMRSGNSLEVVSVGDGRAAVPPVAVPAPPADRRSDQVAVLVEQAPREAAPSVRRSDTPSAATGRGGTTGGGNVAGTRTMTAAMMGSGSWQVLLKHRAGSLEAAVEQVRRRNLLMSFGMLTLLAASVGLVLVSARRAERLASQQMDFVATVSHELRTPLAVIRSAGQNLAAGVVQDPRRYGDLIETEGRRLTDMVEQTLALAGLSGQRKPVAQQPVDAGDVVRSVLAAPETSTRADGVEFDVRIADELPLVLADEMLLRRGVQNLVTNALKYGAAGGWVGVTVDASGSRRGREIRITVSDKGPGVAAEDLPHIFEAFYRGRKAVADQVQGNGLGLHLVKRIAEAHGGRVTLRTSAGGGAAFTLHIPARGDLAMHALAGEQPQTS